MAPVPSSGPRRRALRLAWVLAAALPLAPHVQARDGDCDALLGSYALAP
ncbi:hypothetical protein HF319_06495, partial [Xanthomonas sp. Kuri4-1]